MSKPVVLVVDDNPTTRRLTGAYLQQADYDVLAVDSGAACLEVLAARDLDAIIIDLMMPEMDGIELARRIRALESTRRIPLMMVTANEHDDNAMAALDAGVDAILRQPIDRTSLWQGLEGLLGDTPAAPG